MAYMDRAVNAHPIQTTPINRFNLYQPISREGQRVTRTTSKPWYDLDHPTWQLAVLPDGLQPATIHGHNFYGDNLVTVVYAGCLIHTEVPPEEQSITKSPYYGPIIDQLPSNLPVTEILEAAAQHNLYVGCNGRLTPSKNTIAYSWTFSTSTGSICKGTGSLSTSGISNHRAYLGGVLATLIIMHHIETLAPPSSDLRSTLFIQNKKALAQAFPTSPIGIKDVTLDHYDFISDIRLLTSQLRTKISPE